jgi:6-pyruvoyltetrahydropterin/6-carboxytetrahydropterin synthase
MKYRVCKSFEVESGHMLLKHPGRCRYPHGHTRRIDIVLSSAQLDANDMVCDFAAIKHAVGAYIDQFDHSMAMNGADPLLGVLSACRPDAAVGSGGAGVTGAGVTGAGVAGAGGTGDAAAAAAHPALGRVVVFEGQDPTTEVMAKAIYEFVAARLASREAIVAPSGAVYRFPVGVEVERVRVTETTTSWAEYGVS